MAGQKAEV